jgi:hypothetical protein
VNDQEASTAGREPTEEEAGAAGRQPTEEELRAAMEEQMRRLRVQDVLLQTVATLVNLGGRRLGLAPDGAGERDLEQARLAIEGTRALVPLLASEEARAVKDALSQLQVAYAREAGAGEQAAGEPAGERGAPTRGSPEERPAGDEPPAPDAGAAERARARSKIWTPPGS